MYLIWTYNMREIPLNLLQGLHLKSEIKKFFKKKIISKFNGKCFNFDFESAKNEWAREILTERDSQNGSKSKAVSIVRKKSFRLSIWFL